jgi:hypothetical protein
MITSHRPPVPVTRSSAVREADQPRNRTRRRMAPHACHQARPPQGAGR